MHFAGRALCGKSHRNLEGAFLEPRLGRLLIDVYSDA